jgi:hypothetical protein
MVQHAWNGGPMKGGKACRSDIEAALPRHATLGNHVFGVWCCEVEMHRNELRRRGGRTELVHDGDERLQALRRFGAFHCSLFVVIRDDAIRRHDVAASAL